MAPLTSPNDMSIFRNNMIFAPILITISVSRPAVYEGSFSYLSNHFCARSLKLGVFWMESSVSSASRWILSYCISLRIAKFKALHKLRVGKRHTVSGGKVAIFKDPFLQQVLVFWCLVVYSLRLRLHLIVYVVAVEQMVHHRVASCLL